MTAAPALASSSYPTRSSPLSRTGDGPPPPRSNSRDPYASGPDSPVRSRPPAAGYPRARSGSNASSLASPSTARPIFASARDIPPVAPPRPWSPPSIPRSVVRQAWPAWAAGVSLLPPAQLCLPAHHPSPRPQGQSLRITLTLSLPLVVSPMFRLWKWF
ncbi:hypothetical protein B0H10DRAFT_794202 [Mycena sp. CBHHK59/15]|nr:hypothetical protein B0H10DRAFT_794202 [Mycena sp. CBHHK59/15]